MFDSEQMNMSDLVRAYIEDYYPITLPLLRLEKAEHIRVLQLFSRVAKSCGYIRTT
jgi:hypothetical protein